MFLNVTLHLSDSMKVLTNLSLPITRFNSNLNKQDLTVCETSVSTNESTALIATDQTKAANGLNIQLYWDQPTLKFYLKDPRHIQIAQAIFRKLCSICSLWYFFHNNFALHLIFHILPKMKYFIV